MKKIFALGLILVLLSAAAMAQGRVRDRLNNQRTQLIRPEVIELRKQIFRREVIQRRTHREGVITPYEGRKLARVKQKSRRVKFHLRHNNRKRVS